MGFMLGALFLIFAGFLRSSESLRPLKERASAAGSWSDERLFLRRGDNDPSSYSQWNITGTYRGRWSFVEMSNVSSRFLDFGRSDGVSVLELVSTPTKITGVHYVKGAVIFHDVFDNGHDLGVAQMRVEGVYIWPFKQLRMVASSGTDGEPFQEEDYLLSSPYHLLGVFSSQVFQEPYRDKLRRRKKSFTYDMEKHCNIEIAARVSRVSSQSADLVDISIFKLN